MWYKKYSDRFLLKKRDDRSLALLDIFKIFIARNGDIFTFEKHIYLIFSIYYIVQLFSDPRKLNQISVATGFK